MKIFNKYSLYYDLIYKSKDYSRESKYIDSLIKTYETNSKDILDFGCGTGKHDIELAKLGYKIIGIDRSKKMIQLAKDNLQKVINTNRFNLEVKYINKDIQKLFINKNFDCCISLFHVFGYLTKGQEILITLETLNKKLNNKGLLIFEVWHGPSILYEKPEIRVRHFSNHNVKLTRIVEPEINCQKNTVNALITLYIENKKDGAITKVSERHTVRYFFEDEIKNFLTRSNFKLLHKEEFLSKCKLSRKTWSACYIARKI